MRALTHRERGANPVPDSAFVFTAMTGAVLVWKFLLPPSSAPAILGFVAAVVLAGVVLFSSTTVYPGEPGCLVVLLVPMLLLAGAFGGRALAARTGQSPAGTQWLILGLMFLPAFLAAATIRLFDRSRE